MSGLEQREVSDGLTTCKQRVTGAQHQARTDPADCSQADEDPRQRRQCAQQVGEEQDGAAGPDHVTRCRPGRDQGGDEGSDYQPGQVCRGETTNYLIRPVQGLPEHLHHSGQEGNDAQGHDAAIERSGRFAVKSRSTHGRVTRDGSRVPLTRTGGRRDIYQW